MSIRALLASFMLATTAFAGDGKMMIQAQEWEMGGEKLKAAAVYEDMIREDATQTQVLAGRLVRIYAESGETNKALSWAQVVMKKNPDPQAYLAGVYTMLGQLKEARAILDPEIAACREPHRKTTLCWQLADVCERFGDLAGAETALNAAAKASVGLPESSTAERRLKTFLERKGK